MIFIIIIKEERSEKNQNKIWTIVFSTFLLLLMFSYCIYTHIRVVAPNQIVISRPLIIMIINSIVRAQQIATKNGT